MASLVDIEPGLDLDGDICLELSTIDGSEYLYLTLDNVAEMAGRFGYELSAISL